MRTLLPALVILLVGCPADGEPPLNVITGPLRPLHAEPDVAAGGRLFDDLGREVRLSGANVNSLGEYWRFDPDVAPTLPIVEDELDLYAGIGWNVVRLLLTWSRVEPAPGEYDEAYLDEVEAAVLLFQDRGIYTLIDLHQDAWGPTLAARPDEDCPEGTFEAVGWDGAPGWATLDGGASRCIQEGTFGLREFSPAVVASFLAFWEDDAGPGGVGVQTRYHAMLGHLAQRFSPYDSVIGYDVMNEPNAWSGVTLALAAPGQDLDDQTPALSRFYERAEQAIHAAEEESGAPHRMFFFEPSPDWAVSPDLAVLPWWDHGDQVVYAPHIYQGGIVPGGLSEAAFDDAVADALTFRGAPIFTGEWGTGPQRATDPDDDYFERHLDLQESRGVGSALWQFRVGCGDPHAAGHPPDGVDPGMWGLFDVDCPSNTTVGFRDGFAAVLRRPLVRAAPGRVDAIGWDRSTGRFEASGSSATAGQELELFLPWPMEASAIDATGLAGWSVEDTTWTAEAAGGSWSIGVSAP